MKRVLLTATLTLLVLLGSFTSTAGALGVTDLLAPVQTVVGIDPQLSLHPLLQSEALTAPDKRVRVIVRKASSDILSSTLAGVIGAVVREEFSYIDSFVIDATLTDLLQLALDTRVSYITPDGPVLRHDAGEIDTSALAGTYPLTVGADRAWQGGVTGHGVTVAVIDTGVDAGHADLAGDVIAVNSNGSAADATDPHGHGTHIAGVITGSSAEGDYLGVAPRARVVSVKIANDAGVASESDLLRGMQWVYANRAQYGIRAVNISVSSGTASSYITSPTAAAAEQLWFAGVVVVTSAGNRGGAGQSWYAPGNDPFVITVGCLDEAQTAATADDSLCSFSQRGTTIEGYAKPEIVAPGRRIVSTLAAGDALLAAAYPERLTDGRYIRLSGTSMSAPVVTGSVALLLERYPQLTPDQIKWLLTETANSYPGQSDAAGALDVHGALLRAAGGDVGSANEGVVRTTGSQSLLDDLIGTTLDAT
ncbi:MAG: S8 family peptidase, partial [Dehalococcoidia bacterium]